MDLLETGSVYLELIYELSKDSENSLEDLRSELVKPTPDLEYLQKQGVEKYRGVGGHSANTAYALSMLKYSVGFLGTIGKDKFAKEILSSLDKVDMRLVRQFDSSGIIVTLLQGDRRITSKFPNANKYLSFIEDDLEIINSSKYIHLGPVDSTNALNAYRQMLSLVDQDHGIFFTPGEELSSLGLAKLNEILCKTRVLFVTEDEIESITSLGFEDGCKRLISEGTHVIVCKGASDVFIASKHSKYSLPMKKTIPVDDSDYLDAYSSGFLSAYMEGYSLECCGKAGLQLAALTSTAYGRNAYPDFKFLKYLLPENE